MSLFLDRRGRYSHGNFTSVVLLIFIFLGIHFASSTKFDSTDKKEGKFKAFVDYTGCYGFGNKAVDFTNAFKKAKIDEYTSLCPECTQFGCDIICGLTKPENCTVEDHCMSENPNFAGMDRQKFIQINESEIYFYRSEKYFNESRIEVSLNYSLSRFFPVQARSVSAYLYITAPSKGQTDSTLACLHPIKTSLINSDTISFKRNDTCIDFKTQENNNKIEVTAELNIKLIRCANCLNGIAGLTSASSILDKIPAVAGDISAKTPCIFFQ
jgi:hypothetical protein